MIALDRFDKWSDCLDTSGVHFLDEAEYWEYLAIPADQRVRQIRSILEGPIAHFTIVNEVFFRARWAEALGAVRFQGNATLLEVATGDTDVIPRMMARVYPGSCYITANMNRILTGRLREKTGSLALSMKIIEEDAAVIGQYLGHESVDVVAFQHGVNDVIQAILCEKEGVDTINTDWMETLPGMIAMIQREVAANTLEQNSRTAFLDLLTNLTAVLKRDGLIIMNHYMFQLDLDWGYPPDLWANFIPMTRDWVKGLPGCEEVFFEGFDPHWWMFLRKTEQA